MSNASDYFEDAVLNCIRGNAGITAITPYVALFDGDPGEDGSGALEVTVDVRAAGRVQASFGEPSSGEIANDTVVDFGDAANAATVAGFGIFDAATDGNLIAYGTFTSQSINAGNPVSFPVGNLTITVA